MSKKVVTLGEIMLRLSTPDFKRFVQADSFDVTYGGGEANVAAALCNYGLNGTFVTKVPNNPIGQSAINHRKKLWSKEKARQVMTELCKYVDVCIGNEEDADTTLGFTSEGTDVTKGELNLDGYKSVFKQMKDKFGFKYIASTLRESHS